MLLNDISSQLNVTLSGSILSVQLNRPDKMNAFTFEMYRALTNLLQQVENEADIYVVVLSGSGGHFSAGNDIKDFVTVVEEKGMDRHHDAPNFIDTLREFSKPIIAAVDGFAVGMALRCCFTLIWYMHHQRPSFAHHSHSLAYVRKRPQVT